MGTSTFENNNIGITFNLNVDPVLADYNVFFSVGSKSYVSDPNGVGGVFIYWVDENGTLWWTTGGSQSGSIFTITNTGSTTIYGTAYNWVQGTFSCILYSGSSSDQKTITNGKFKALFTPFQ